MRRDKCVFLYYLFNISRLSGSFSYFSDYTFFIPFLSSSNQLKRPGAWGAVGAKCLAQWPLAVPRRELKPHEVSS